MISERPNDAIMQMLKDLPAYCPHYKNGCQSVFTNDENLKEHKKACIYRKVYSINHPICKELVIFKDAIEHLNAHNGGEGLKRRVNKTNNDQFIISYPMEHWKTNKDLISHPSRLEASDGSIFYITKASYKAFLFIWIKIFGSPDEVKNYQITMSVKNENGEEELICRRKAHTLDMSTNEILKKQLAFTIGLEAAKGSAVDRRSRYRVRKG